ncbi:MAG: tyrosine-type recombinase/integrase [Frankiaceae bacterium]|nr:tyrosine-type recombinase/integrase [Frankiaceae bacterium]
MAKRRRSNGDGAVYQTKDGRWRATVDLGWAKGTRQRKYLSGPTKAAVSRSVREALAQVESGVPLTRDGIGPTVEEWLWYWHDNVQVRRVREATLSAQEVIIRRHLVPNLGRVRLRELTPEQAEATLVRLEGPGFNSTSVLKVHRCLSRALVVAMQRGLLTRNVCTLIDAPTPRTQEVEPLTKEEARRLLEAAGHRRNSARWVLALATGLRQSEALALAWPHIDLDAGTMATRQAMTRARYVHGCGRPATCGKRPVGCPQRTGHGPELADVKSRAGKRVVTLPAPLVAALRAHRTAQLEERLAAGSVWWTEPTAPKGKSWDLVFRQPDGRPVGHKRDYADWKALLADAGVRDARLHDARHTAASLLLLLKVPARVVMDILGHSNYQLTMNTYSHVAPELNSEAARLMAGALWEDEADDQGAPRRRSGD